MALEDAAAAPEAGSQDGKPEDTAAGNDSTAQDTTEKKYESFRDFVTKEENKSLAERYDSMDSVFDSLSEKQKYIDSSVRVPKDGAPKEEWDKYYKSIGVPESIDGYGVKLPEEVDDTVKDRVERYLSRMHELKAPPQVVQEAYEFLNNEVEALIEADAKAKEEALNKAEADLRKLYGTQDEYDRNMRVSKAFLEKYADSDFFNYLEETGLGNDPRMVQLTARIGSMFSEDFPGEVLKGKGAVDAGQSALEAEYNDRVKAGTVNDPDFQSRWGSFFEKNYPSDT